MSYDVSVIVPCYNSEDTISRCIDSVINQSLGFENIELILFDDVSKDNTRIIMLEYSEKYENIVTIFSDINVGPGMGRNKCIEVASADYIMCLDSDDVYCRDMCQTLYETITAENADIVSCNYYNVDSIRTYKEHYNCSADFERKGSMNVYDEFNSTFFGDILVWNKIFKKSLIVDNKIKFPKDFEDWIFSTKAFLHCEKLIYLEDYFGVKKHFYEHSLSHKTSKECIRYIDVLFEVNELIMTKCSDVDLIKRNKLGDIKDNIIKAIVILSDLNWNDNFEGAFNRVYDYESYFSINESLDNRFFDIIIFFIRKRQVKITYIILKIINFLKRLTFLRIIYNYIRTS